MGLCITSIVKTLTDNHTLDDRNQQGHHVTLLLSETLLSTAILVRGRQRAVCDNTERYVQVLGKFWTVLGQQRGAVRVFQWFQQDGATPTPQTNHWHGYSSDLNPQDFYMWGYLKGRVCGNKPRLSLT